MLAFPIFPAMARIVLPSEHIRGAFADKRKPPTVVGGLCWRYLFYRPVTRQVSSAQMSLTSVFGMGTGGPSSQSTPTILPNKTNALFGTPTEVWHFPYSETFSPRTSD